MDRGGINPLKQNRPGGDVAAEVTLARETLRNARSALDVAVAALPDVNGDEAMATPALLLLLFGAVRAKEQLDKLEAQLGGKLAEA
jgi:hypothetical protein